jgi:hypothetical protein
MYYVGGLATGGVLFVAKVPGVISVTTSSTIGVIKTSGSGADYVHTKINPLH